jgi:hypothetical protein
MFCTTEVKITEEFGILFNADIFDIKPECLSKFNEGVVLSKAKTQEVTGHGYDLKLLFR